MKLTIWGFPVMRLWHLGPDDRPAPRTFAPRNVRMPAPALVRPPATRLTSTPHCSGRHAIEEGLARCEWCDALSDAITLMRDLERRVVVLEDEVAELRERNAS